jgi:histidine ammonia-lyase
MDNTHYISTELLSLEILQEIVLHHYWRSEEAKVNIQNVV